MFQSQTKKLKSTVKLPGKKDQKQKQSESVVLEVPPESIIYQDITLDERIKSKSPNILIKSPKYYLNNREIFINFVTNLFQPYKQEIEEEGSNLQHIKTKKSKDFSLYSTKNLLEII